VLRRALRDVEQLGAEIVHILPGEIIHCRLPQVPHSPARAAREIPPEACFVSAAL
jgi:hypothetical protein